MAPAAEKLKRHGRERERAAVNEAAAAAALANMDEVLTTSEAAEYLKCSEQHLEASRVRGDGPPFTRVGSRIIRYRKSAILAWMAAREVASTSAETPE